MEPPVSCFGRGEPSSHDVAVIHLFYRTLLSSPYLKL